MIIYNSIFLKSQNNFQNKEKKKKNENIIRAISGQ